MFASDRTFRLWDYNISHNQLLLRSPQTPETPRNIDVLFWDVAYLDLPTSLTGLTIARPSTDDLHRIEQSLGEARDPNRVYCLITCDRRYLVDALVFRVLENDLDPSESSLEYFAATKPGRDLGLVLAGS